MSDTVTEFWVVIGQQNDEIKPGIYHKCSPTLCSGRSAPSLPIAVQSHCQTEAGRIFDVLQPVIIPLPLNPSPTALLNAYEGHIETMRNIFVEGGEDFTAVTIGETPGIHRTRASADNGRGNFSASCSRRTDIFWEALAFMIVRGIASRMPPMDMRSRSTTRQLGNGLRRISVQSPNASIGAPTRQASRAVTPSTSNSISTPSSVRTDSPAPSLASANPPPEQANATPVPMIYSNVCSIQCILSSSYHAVDPPRNADVCARTLGTKAAKYLVAHGYTSSSINEIISAWAKCEAKSQFALRLWQKGMAMTEAMYLQELIS
ncbi:hypothetical protein JVU11DRAFT_7726 [Chiua virens]|nr:hypothetical protein JVU11DRAFT_7726 [Chiua virens]